MQPDELSPESTLPEPITIAEEREPIWGYTDVALVLGLLFAFSLILIIAVALLAIPYPSLRTDQTPIALPFQILFYAALYLSFRIVLRLRYRQPVLSSLGWRKPRINLALAGAGGLLLAFVVSALGSLLKTPKIPLPFDKLASTPLSMIFLAVVAVFLAPIFEELFFRGFLQPLLSRTFGTIAGIVITAIAFGMLHGFEYSWVWQYALLISLVGAVLGWLRARTNSIIPSTVMHGCFNAVSMVALAFGKNI